MVNGERIRVPAEELRRHWEALLCALGVEQKDAYATADVFVQAECMGEESHGSRLFLHILGRVKAGGDIAETRITEILDRGGVALWDAERSLGQVVAARAMRRAIEKARQFGIGFVMVRNSNSYTSAKYYSLMAVEEGMVGITYSNTSRRLMPPEGGCTPVLGSNPLCIAAPTGGPFPFVLDMACTRVAMERIIQANENGEAIPPDWALDADGNATTDPQRALESGALLPFGGYKAFGLAMANEILSSVIAGGLLFCGGSTGFLPYDGPMNTSYSFQAINIEWFMPLPEFRKRMNEVFRHIKSSALRPGVDCVFVPGEKEFLEQQTRLRDGIPLRERVVDELRRWSEELGVAPLGGA